MRKSRGQGTRYDPCQRVVGVGLGARVQSHEDRRKADKLQFLRYHGVGLDIHVVWWLLGVTI